MSDPEVPELAPAAVLDHITSAVLVMRADRQVVYANDGAAAIAGVSRDELTGASYDAERWHTRDRSGRILSPAEYPSGRALRGESVRAAEVVIDSADGREILLLANAEPVRIDGEVRYAVVTMQDATAVAVVERDLQRNRARLAAIVTHAAEAIVLANDAGTYIEANPAAARMLGYERGDLLGLHLADVIVDDVDHEARLASFVQEGSGAAHVRLRRLDGEIIDVEAQSVANVEPGVHLSIWRDVTERRRLTARLRAIVNGSSVGLVLVDERDGVTYANPEAERLLGRDVRGQDVTDALSPALGDEVEAAEAFLAATRIEGEDVVVTAHGGRHLRLLVTRVPETPSEFVLHLEDVTLRHTAEEQLRDAFERERIARQEAAQLAQMKDTFLSAVSHELRTPLTAIQGFVTTLEVADERLDDDQRSLLRSRLRENTTRLAKLLDDLLDIDRLRRGTSHVDATPTRLHKLVSTAARAADDADHELRIIAPDVRVLVDRPKLERIIDNLVSNALRHTPAGTSVVVSASADADVLTLTVEDDGPGIAPEERERLFTMFTKGSSDTAASAGTGVGLALVQEFAGLMNGEVEVTESELGGAAFTVRVPTTIVD